MVMRKRAESFYYKNIVIQIFRNHWERFKEYKNMLDFDLLKQYAAKFNLDVIRQTGFFLDQLRIETRDLLKIISGKTSYSRMTKKSKNFNAKWRLYFDHSIIE